MVNSKSALNFCQKLAKIDSETFQILKEAYGHDAMIQCQDL